MPGDNDNVMICVSYPLLGQGLRRMIEANESNVLISHGCTLGQCSLPGLVETETPNIFVVEFGCEGHKYLLEHGVEAPIIAVNMANNETYLYRIKKTTIENSEDLVELVHQALEDAK